MTRPQSATLDLSVSAEKFPALTESELRQLNSIEVGEYLRLQRALRAGRAPAGCLERARAIQRSAQIRLGTVKAEPQQRIVVASTNPWVSGNLTEQMNIQAKDPTRAARLRAQAGA